MSEQAEKDPSVAGLVESVVELRSQRDKLIPLLLDAPQCRCGVCSLGLPCERSSLGIMRVSEALEGALMAQHALATASVLRRALEVGALCDPGALLPDGSCTHREPSLGLCVFARVLLEGDQESGSVQGEATADGSGVDGDVGGGAVSLG